MGIEIERKFLVKNIEFLEGVDGIRYSQGYIPSEGNPGVRIRIAGEKAFITLKSDIKGAKVRHEFEYEIPVSDAGQMLETFCRKPLIEKVRYIIKYSGLIWEVDVFEGDNKGLIVAEVELETEDQKVDLPDWIAVEVTGDKKYQNSQLGINPYCVWS